MARFEWPDLSCLATLARDQSIDVRPVLLRVHTDLFVAAPSRDAATIKAFEALALGFLPVVDEATAVLVATKLAPLGDTPPSVIDALLRRGGSVREAVLAVPGREGARSRHVELASGGHLMAGDIADLLALRNDAVDLALARNRRAQFDSRHLRDLAARAREWPELASALLRRDDLDPGGEAILYLHADAARRGHIRGRLESIVALAPRGPAAPRPDAEAIDRLFASAAANPDLFGHELAKLLGLPAAPDWRFHLEPRRELLALALVAAGIPDEARIRIFLTAEPAIAHSVQAVFELARTARKVPRSMAIYLTESVLGLETGMSRKGRHVPVIDVSAAASRNAAVQPAAAHRHEPARRIG